MVIVNSLSSSMPELPPGRAKSTGTDERAVKIVFGFRKEALTVSLRLKAVRVAVCSSIRFNNMEECLGGMRKVRLAAVDKAQTALDLQFLDAHPHQRTRGNVFFDGEAGNQR